MAISSDSSAVDLTGAALHELIKGQNWFQRNRNTVTTLVGFLVTLVGYAATTPLFDNGWGSVLVVIAGFAATVFGVKMTPNGFSTSQVAKVNALTAQRIDSTPLVVSTADDLSAEVVAFNSREE